jgi:dihydrodipicolinate synthase/N-acetylneuraminate lyase
MTEEALIKLLIIPTATLSALIVQLRREGKMDKEESDDLMERIVAISLQVGAAVGTEGGNGFHTFSEKMKETVEELLEERI